MVSNQRVTVKRKEKWDPSNVFNLSPNQLYATAARGGGREEESKHFRWWLSLFFYSIIYSRKDERIRGNRNSLLMDFYPVTTWFFKSLGRWARATRWRRTRLFPPPPVHYLYNKLCGHKCLLLLLPATLPVVSAYFYWSVHCSTSRSANYFRPPSCSKEVHNWCAAPLIHQIINIKWKQCYSSDDIDSYQQQHSYRTGVCLLRAHSSTLWLVLHTRPASSSHHATETVEIIHDISILNVRVLNAILFQLAAAGELDFCERHLTLASNHQI